MKKDDDIERIKAYMEAKMKHIKMYDECMNLADGLDVEKFAELVRADEREACAKRQWIGLTDEEIHNIKGYREDRELFRFAKVIEAKLKEKNT